MKRMTELAHDAIARVVRPGETVVDATAGKGHDTVWLVHLVGPSGKVFAIDRQADAIRATAARLGADRLNQAVLLEADHANLNDIIPGELHGRVAAVMFNLGYLPGGNKAIVTTPNSTRLALEAAVSIIRPGGIISVVVYPGHPGGAEEANMVADFLAALPRQRFRTEAITPASIRKAAPALHLIYYLGSA